MPQSLQWLRFVPLVYTLTIHQRTKHCDHDCLWLLLKSWFCLGKLLDLTDIWQEKYVILFLHANEGPEHDETKNKMTYVAIEDLEQPGHAIFQSDQSLHVFSVWVAEYPNLLQADSKYVVPTWWIGFKSGEMEQWKADISNMAVSSSIFDGHVIFKYGDHVILPATI